MDGRGIDYKMQWQRELARRQQLGLTLPDPVPHPDDLVIDMQEGTVHVTGPVTGEEKAAMDACQELADEEGVSLLDIMMELKEREGEDSK